MERSLMRSFSPHMAKTSVEISALLGQALKYKVLIVIMALA